MKQFLLVILIFQVACDQKGPRVVTENKINNIDTNKINTLLINSYRSEELRSLDSIHYYDLDSIYHTAINFLYSIYGDQNLPEINTNRSITVGESDIRVIDFTFLSKSKRRLTFDIFWPDSLPVLSQRTFDKLGSMIYCFEIDIVNKKILSGLTSAEGKVPELDINNLAKARVESEEFKKYIAMFSSKLNKKFKIPARL